MVHRPLPLTIASSAAQRKLTAVIMSRIWETLFHCLADAPLLLSLGFPVIIQIREEDTDREKGGSFRLAIAVKRTSDRA